jgi:hypothetical protein
VPPGACRRPALSELQFRTSVLQNAPTAPRTPCETAPRPQQTGIREREREARAKERAREPAGGLAPGTQQRAGAAISLTQPPDASAAPSPCAHGTGATSNGRERAVSRQGARARAAPSPSPRAAGLPPAVCPPRPTPPGPCGPAPVFATSPSSARAFTSLFSRPSSHRPQHGGMVVADGSIDYIDPSSEMEMTEMADRSRLDLAHLSESHGSAAEKQRQGRAAPGPMRER